MGILMKLIDTVIFFFFLVIAIGAPLLDSQTFIPSHFFPTFLIDFKSWYTQHYGDYLFLEKPHFFVGLVSVQLLLQWPLAVASLYAIVAGKSWLPTTCLIYAATTFTSVVAVLSDMIGSGKASEKLLMLYFPFLGFSVLAFLRGLVPYSPSAIGVSKRPGLSRKKRA